MPASLIQRIFGHSDAAILCPRCEKPLEGHSEADCARKMSRRWFLGATLGAVAGAVVAPALPQITIASVSPIPSWASGIYYVSNADILTAQREQNIFFSKVVEQAQYWHGFDRVRG